MLIKNLIAQIGRELPTIWRDIDTYRENRSWPDNVFIPMYVFKESGEIDTVYKTSVLSGIAAWRVGQGVYRFDQDIFNEIANTPFTGKIPLDVLFRLPEWCIYVEFPPDFAKFNGMLVYFDYYEEKHELRFLFEEKNNDLDTALIPAYLILEPNTTINDCLLKLHDISHESAENNEKNILNFVKSAYNLTDEDIGDPKLFIQEALNSCYGTLKDLIPKVLPLVLYICSENADISDIPAPLKPTKTKKGMRFFPPNQPKIYECGYRYANFIKHYKKSIQESNEKTGRHVTPHLRRAHWHGFWTGSHKSDRKFILKWLPPTPISMKNDTEIPITIRKIRKKDDNKPTK